MDMQEAINQYFSGWNSHDAKQVSDLFSDLGTYEDPVSRMAVRSIDIETIMWSIESVLPDFR